MRRLLFLLLLLPLFTFPLVAQESTVGQLLIDAATDADEPQFQVLLAAALESGVLTILDDPEEDITVFAPTDEAFFAALDELGISYRELTEDSNRLIAILTYHVVRGRVAAADLPTTSTLNTFYEGTSIAVTASGDDIIVLNDNAQILESDITASNGLIHVIDRVLLPPRSSGTGTGASGNATLADIVDSRDDLSTIWEALEATGFTNALAQNDQMMTLFLPTNAALEAAGLTVNDLGISAIAYHAVAGQYLLDDLADFTSLPSQEGDEIAITVTDAGITLNGEAGIVEADIIASNGVIHIIDRPLSLPGVILPTESTEEGGG